MELTADLESLVRSIVGHFHVELAAITAAPVIFISAAALCGFVMWLVVKLQLTNKDATIAGRDGIIASKDAPIETLRNERLYSTPS